MTLAPATGISDAICMRCDYDLRGLPGDSRCPECGLAVARSLAPAEDLRHAPPGWLAGLAWGCGLLLGSMLGFIAFLFLRGALRGVLTYSEWVNVAAATAFVGGATAGVWLLTRPQRKFAPSGAALRWGLRALALLALADVATLYWVVFTGNYQLPPFQQWVMPAAAVLFPALLFLHLRRLARRVLDPRLAEHCAIIGVGTALMMATALAFQVRAVVFRPTRQPQWVYVVLMVVLPALLVTFFLWSLLTLLRFTLAFRRARRESVLAWEGATPP